MDQPPTPDFHPELSTPWFHRRGPRIFAGLLILILIPVAWTTQPLIGRGRSEAPAAIDPTRLEADVRQLVEGHPRRSDAHPEVLGEAAAWIASALRATGAQVSLQSYTVVGQTFRNVRARYGATPGDLLVVGAHYDACAGLPGADDNASGVAALLALGRVLGTKPPKGPVELVAYTLEEPPHFRKASMGSAMHVLALRQEGVQVKAMLCLEMLGTFSDEPGSQHYPLPGLGLLYPDRGNFITVVGDLSSPRLVRRVKGAMQGASPLPVWSINAPAAIPGVDFSDHRNYWAAGIPAVMVTDTAFFRNPRYHTAADTPDRLDYRRMAQAVQEVHAAILELDH